MSEEWSDIPSSTLGILMTLLSSSMLMTSTSRGGLAAAVGMGTVVACTMVLGALPTAGWGGLCGGGDGRTEDKAV